MTKTRRSGRGWGNKALALCTALLLLSTFLPLSGFANGLSPFDEQAPTITWPAASDITYGQTLSESALLGGSTEYGSFAWTYGATRPSAPSGSYPVTFTPNRETAAAYGSIGIHSQNVFIVVEKAPAPTIVWPTAEPLAVGQSVGEAVLTGGSVEYGIFVWASGDAGIKPLSGTYSYTVNFTPNADTQNNYETIYTRSAKVSLEVRKTDPPGLKFPTTTQVKEEKGKTLKLRDIPLIGGEGDGSYAWYDPDFEPSAGADLYNVVFTPNDTERYNRVIDKVYLEVVAAETPEAEDYDTRYTSDSLTIRVGILNGRWKTLKVYTTVGEVSAIGTFNQNFTWIDRGNFLVFQAVRGVSLRELILDALAVDGEIEDFEDGAIQTIAFHTKDKAYYTYRTPESLWRTGMYYFPSLLRDWDFVRNKSLVGDSAAWAEAQSVEPMITLQEYWHRVKPGAYQNPSTYWSKVTSGARFRLAVGMPSPTSMTAHDTAKYIDRIDLVFSADAVAEGGTYEDYFNTFTDPQDPPETDPPETDPPETDPPETDPPETPPPPSTKPGGGGTDTGTGTGADTGSGMGEGTGGSPGSIMGTDRRVVELTHELVTLSVTPDFDGKLLRGSELLQAKGISLIEMAGSGGEAGSPGGSTTIKDTGVPLGIEPFDPRVLFIVSLILVASFVSGGASMFITGRITRLEGAFHWISAQ